MGLECKTAVVEIGYTNKDEYILVQGEIILKERMLTHTYWYPEDITNDEINQEITDLCEHYKNVVIVLPIPAQLHLEVLQHE